MSEKGQVEMPATPGVEKVHFRHWREAMTAGARPAQETAAKSGEENKVQIA